MQQSASNKVRNAPKNSNKSPVILFMFLCSLNLRVMQQTCRKWHVISMVITRKLNHLVRILTRGEITPLTIQEKHDEQRFRYPRPGDPGRTACSRRVCPRVCGLRAPLTAAQAVIEAERCYYCFDAPCSRACPADIDVPSFIQRIAQSNDRGAAEVILRANVLGGICSRVCPTETL
jgi:hypothetical protein